MLWPTIHHACTHVGHFIYHLVQIAFAGKFSILHLSIGLCLGFHARSKPVRNGAFKLRSFQQLILLKFMFFILGTLGYVFFSGPPPCCSLLRLAWIAPGESPNSKAAVAIPPCPGVTEGLRATPTPVLRARTREAKRLWQLCEGGKAPLLLWSRDKKRMKKGFFLAVWKLSKRRFSSSFFILQLSTTFFHSEVKIPCILIFNNLKKIPYTFLYIPFLSFMNNLNSN